MKIKDNVRMTGRVVIEVRDEHGRLKEHREFDNLVVGGGKSFIASRMAANTLAVMSHMALGSGAAAAAPGDLALGAELGRIALSGGAPVANVVSYTATFPAGTATGPVTEAGIFNANPAGTMLARVVFPVVNKGANDSISISWTVTVN